MITDSHGEAHFGSEMVKLVEEANLKIDVYAVGGSRARDWNAGLPQPWGYWEYSSGTKNIRSFAPKTPQLKTLLLKHKPNIVIVELGTNQIWYEFNAAERREMINLVMAIMDSGAKCIWVGPPSLRVTEPVYVKRLKQVQSTLMKEISSLDCKVFKSWDVTSYPPTGEDGIHYIGKLAPLARQWAREAFSFIRPFLNQSKTF